MESQEKKTKNEREGRGKMFSLSSEFQWLFTSPSNFIESPVDGTSKPLLFIFKISILSVHLFPYILSCKNKRKPLFYLLLLFIFLYFFMLISLRFVRSRWSSAIQKNRFLIDQYSISAISCSPCCTGRNCHCGWCSWRLRQKMQDMWPGVRAQPSEGQQHCQTTHICPTGPVCIQGQLDWKGPGKGEPVHGRTRL